jgi:organic radical activating enzyme
MECGINGFKYPTFSWMLFDTCNFSCSYCCSSEFNEGDIWKDRDKISKYIRYVLSQLKTYKFEFELEILGGEPTLYYDLNNIINKVSEIDNVQRIRLITNLSKPTKYFEDFNSDKLIITPSYHHEYNTDRFIRRCIELSNIGKSIRPIINIYPDKKIWESIKTSILILQDFNIPYTMNLLRKVSGKFNWEIKYPDGVLDYFSDEFKSSSRIEDIPINGILMTEEEIIINGHDRKKGWNCKSLFFNIDIDGLITNMCSHTRVKFGSKFEDINQIYKCSYDFCECSLMCNYEKRSN